MGIPEDQVNELKSLCAEVQQCGEGDRTYLQLSGFFLPEKCVPNRMDVLLCPTGYDGYPFRFFFAERVQSHSHLNWNSVRILERNWHSFSWKVSPETRLIQMVAVFLRAFK